MPGIGISIANRIGRKSSLPYWSQRFPSSLIAVSVSATQIDLSWTNNGNADYTGHKVYISTNGINYTLKDTIATIGTTYSAAGLTAGNTYYFYIVAYKGNGVSIISNIATDSSVSLGKVDYWHLDESSGNATGENDTVLINNNIVTYTAGKIANAAEFASGNTNKSLTINSNLGLNYASAKTISCWVNINKALGVGESYAFVSALFGTNPGNYNVLIYTLAGGPGITMNTGILYQITMTSGRWYHLTLVWDQAGNSAKCYINGELAITDVVFASNYAALTTKFSIGQFNGGSFASSLVDEVGYWNRVLVEEEVRKLYSSAMGKVIVNSAAHCWFTSPKAIYDNSVGKSYIGVISSLNLSAFFHSVIEINHINGYIKRTQLSVSETDDHNEPSIIIRSSDNKLIAAYTEHASTTTLRLKISTNALDSSAWGNEITATGAEGTDRVTYANIFEVTNGDIYIFYRLTSLSDVHWAYIKSIDGGSNWGSAVLFSNKTYHRICQNKTNKDIIHFVGSQHPNYLEYPHNIVHFYFNANTNTWHKSDGTNISVNLPDTNANATIIRALNTPFEQWIEDIFLDLNGYPRVLLTYYPDAINTPKNKYLHYSEFDGSIWSTPYEIYQSLNRGPNPLDDTYEPFYPPLAGFDRGNANRIFASKEVDGICEIFLLTRIASNNFTVEQKTFNSAKDQWRPISTDAPNKNILWLNKLRYTSYQNFDEQLVADTF